MTGQNKKRVKKLLIKIEYLVMFVFIITWCAALGNNDVAYASDTLRISCSAQIYSALEKERLEIFKDRHGVNVNVTICSSSEAISHLENDLCDMAITVLRLPKQLTENGYEDIPYCKDPLVILANPVCDLTDISEDQLRAIFSGEISNWKDLGNPDKDIVVIIPDEKTGAYKNFKRLVMKNRDMVFNLKTNISTRVIETTRRFPWSVSFTTCGAVDWKKVGLKKIKIDGFSCDQIEYPYYQVYSFAVKGHPKGEAQAFINFAVSETGQRVIEKKGMVPIDDYSFGDN